MNLSHGESIIRVGAWSWEKRKLKKGMRHNKTNERNKKKFQPDIAGLDTVTVQ
jgi:hypothetical protein